MNKLLFGVLATITAASASAQSITIMSADMPVVGDKLLHSNATVPANFSINDTGANKTWDFSNLNPQSQSTDDYKTAISAGFIGSNIGLTAYGYKVFDSLSFPGAPVSAKNGYTFFNIKSGPSRYVAEGFGANISGLPIAAGYSKEDTIYVFPLTYGNTKTSTFKLTASLSGLGSLSQQGTRTTKVDAWGTIKTPYFTTPARVIRVRSEVDEIDTITITFGTTMTIPVPRHYVEYKWLANNEHYPVLFITTNMVGTTETPTTAMYRDSPRSLGVVNTAPSFATLQTVPNPATSEVSVKVPANWKHYTLRMYDMSGKVMSQTSDVQHISVTSLPSGRYFIIAECGAEMGISQFVK